MSERSDPSPDMNTLREKVIGLGERSIRKSYYPELLQQLSELERFRALLDQSPDAILLAQSATGRIIDANRAACGQFGRSSAELLACSVSELVLPETSRRIEACVADGSLRDTKEQIIATDITRPDGSVTVVEMTVRSVTFGDAGYTVIVARDITDRKRAEEERNRLEAQIRHLQKLETVGLLAGGIAHDFNNLLMPVLGYTTLLHDGLAEGDPRREQLRMIREAAERARDLTRQLLTFSRKQVLDLKTVDFGAIVRKLENVLRRTIRENVGIEIRIPSSLGLVRADVGGIEQVLVNLSINARDAMPEGGMLTIEAQDIEVDAPYAALYPDAAPGPYVMLAVSDTGVGMDESTKEHIFEPFFTTKEPGKGTGLGLSIVYGIIKQHGGFISVYSELAHGTTFKIFLPRAQKSDAAAEEQALAQGIVHGSETILVAEDNEGVRGLVCTILNSLGYQVLSAETEAGCIELAEKHEGPVDLLLTDVIMPKMNGKDLYERLKSIRPGLKVLYMSGYPDNAVGQHSVLETGMNFIQKPFSIPTLSEKIRQALVPQ